MITEKAYLSQGTGTPHVSFSIHGLHTPLQISPNPLLVAFTTRARPHILFSPRHASLRRDPNHQTLGQQPEAIPPPNLLLSSPPRADSPDNLASPSPPPHPSPGGAIPSPIFSEILLWNFFGVFLSLFVSGASRPGGIARLVRALSLPRLPAILVRVLGFDLTHLRAPRARVLASP
jgi:hypothetical protein